jgi:hypothetical protein
MNKEDLKKLGIEDEELVQKIIVLHGKDIEAHKASLTTAQTELTTTKAQLAEAGTAIEGFKKLDVAGVQKAADDWKAKAEQATADAVKQVADVKFNYALNSALVGAKAKDPADIIPHLKRDMLKLGDDGKFVGLTEQLEPLKTSKSYLFEGETPDPKFLAGGGGNQPILGDATIEAARKAAGLPPTKS